jgi:alkylated DNA nucleotide flippase Atl1
MGKPQISNLFLKRTHGAAMDSSNSLTLVHGGIAGDVSCSTVSPRQVLIVRDDDLRHFSLPQGYLRENIVVSGLPECLFIPGNQITFGSGACIHLTFYCEPCKKIGERVSRLSDLQRRRGILGIVVRAGEIATASELQVGASSLKPMADEPRHRVHAVIAAIPKGRVIDYATLLVAAGLQRPYFRVIPKYIESALELDLPVHRVVDSGGGFPAVAAGKFYLLQDELANTSDQRSTQTELFDHVSERCWAAPDSIRWKPDALELLTSI